jgi:hypothetical protein
MGGILTMIRVIYKDETYQYPGIKNALVMEDQVTIERDKFWFPTKQLILFV